MIRVKVPTKHPYDALGFLYFLTRRVKIERGLPIFGMMYFSGTLRKNMSTWVSVGQHDEDYKPNVAM